MRLVLYRGVWCAYWTDSAGRSHRRSLRTKDRQAAERLLVDLQRQPSGSTVGDIFAAYLADKGVERARFAWKRLAPTFGHLRPDQVDRVVCRTYLAQRRRDGALDGTIIKELSSLRAALRWHDKNTPAFVELPPEPPPKSRHLTREEYRAFRDAAHKTPHLYVFVAVAYGTAGRASAVLELTWDRVDMTAGVIRLGLGERRAKGRATVPITGSTREALEAAKPAALSNYVVEYAGRRVLSVKRAFAAAAKQAGVPWCTPHVLRHTAAVHMVEGGVPIEEVAQYLGHTSVGVTYRVYARFSPTHLRRAAAALE
jgi:integrase